MPEVSVVIPHYNRSTLLRQTIESVRIQNVDCELIVVDDGSDKHELSEVLKLREENVLVICRKDGIKGPSTCRNLGWRASTSPLVMFLDSDDLLAPWCLRQRLQVSTDEHRDAYVFPVMLFNAAPGDLDLYWNTMEGDDLLLRFLLSDPPWHTSSVLWQRTSLEMIGGFNESVFYGDDAELHSRALIRGLQFKLCSESMADVFVRRSQSPRITNTPSDLLLDSRLQRLRYGTESVMQCTDPKHRLAWQGQYFAECEFLLFNVPNSRSRQESTVSSWREDWNPNILHYLAARAYLNAAHFFQHRCYLALRLARRFAMLILPREFFPTSKTFEKASLSRIDYEHVVDRLARKDPAPK